jgi:hypothetical protein
MLCQCNPLQSRVSQACVHFVNIHSLLVICAPLWCGIWGSWFRDHVFPIVVCLLCIDSCRNNWNYPLQAGYVDDMVVNMKGGGIPWFVPRGGVNFFTRFCALHLRKFYYFGNQWMLEVCLTMEEILTILVGDLFWGGGGAGCVWPVCWCKLKNWSNNELNNDGPFKIGFLEGLSPIMWWIVWVIGMYSRPPSFDSLVA